MNKIYKQANAENGWIVNYEILQQIKDSNIDLSLGLEEIEQVILTLADLGYLEMYDEIDTSKKSKKYCTANRDYQDICWLDIGRPDLCWINDQPQCKEDCEYWEEKEA